MKLLFYNWADCCSQAGGGVTVYLRNLLVTSTLAGHDISMLSSGYAYDLLGRPYWRALQAMDGMPAKRFEIVNSRLMAPALMAFGDSHELRSPEDASVFLDFMRRNGPFDLIHFHNLEGLSLEALRTLREQHPRTRLVFTLHNYFPFCSQVNLFLTDDNASCRDYHNGQNCQQQCRKHASNFALWQRLLRVEPRLHRVKGMPGYDLTKKVVLRLRPLFATSNASTPEERYIHRREAYVELLNKFDLILCVSERVREIALSFGFDPARTEVDYIGTSMAEVYGMFPRRTALPAQGEHLVLTYLGYVRHDKGFHFLLDALTQLPHELTSRLTLQFAALGCEGRFEEYVRRRCRRFATVLIKNGYRREELFALLSYTTLGIVPVIWEDCLPQVALEMHCHGVPLLCSDMGGAKELAQCEDFVFTAGDAKSFAERLERIVTGKVPLTRYWERARRPLTMEEHAAGLIRRYQALLEPTH